MKNQMNGSVMLCVVIAAVIVLTGCTSMSCSKKSTCPVKKESTAIKDQAAAKPVVPQAAEGSIKSDDATVLSSGFNAVWLASQKTIQQMGLVSISDRSEGHIQARIRMAVVDVNIEKVDAKSTRVKVNALKDAAIDDALNAEIFGKIKAASVLY